MPSKPNVNRILQNNALPDLLLVLWWFVRAFGLLAMLTEKAYDSLVCVVDVVARERGCLEKVWGLVSLRKLKAVFASDLALALSVDLVADEDELGVAVLRSCHLFVVFGYAKERALARDRIDENERLTVSKIDNERPLRMKSAPNLRDPLVPQCCKVLY